MRISTDMRVNNAGDTTTCVTDHSTLGKTWGESFVIEKAKGQTLKLVLG